MPGPERRELGRARMLWEEGNNLTKVTSQGWSWGSKPQHLTSFLLTVGSPQTPEVLLLKFLSRQKAGWDQGVSTGAKGATLYQHTEVPSHQQCCPLLCRTVWAQPQFLSPVWVSGLGEIQRLRPLVCAVFVCMDGTLKAQLLPYQH